MFYYYRLWWFAAIVASLLIATCVGSALPEKKKALTQSQRERAYRTCDGQARELGEYAELQWRNGARPGDRFVRPTYQWPLELLPIFDDVFSTLATMRSEFLTMSREELARLNGPDLAQAKCYERFGLTGLRK